MITWMTVFYSGIAILTALVLPVAAAIWFWRKTRTPFTTILAGALTFFVMQFILRIPLLQVINIFDVFQTDTTAGLLIYSGFLAVTAALFEELGRFLFFKLFRRQGDWNNAVAFGIGHGGIEAILLLGINSVPNTIMLALLAAGVSLPLPEEALQPFFDSVPLDFLAGGVERLLTLPVHIAFSILVVAGIAKKKFSFVGLAILGHTLLNFPLLWLSSNLGTWPTEAYILLWSMAAWFFIFRSKKLFE